MLGSNHQRCVADALYQALESELIRARDNPLHGMIAVSHKMELLSNGIARCSVQLECKAGCGWLIGATTAQDIRSLMEKLVLIERILIRTLESAPSERISEILSSVFPENMVEDQNCRPKGIEESDLNVKPGK